MVDWNIKESLDLRCMQIHCDNSVSAGLCQQICNELCRNCYSRLILTILPRVSEIRNDRSYFSCRRSFCRVNRKQKLHQIVCGWIRRLNNVDVGAANIVNELYPNLAVAEVANIYPAQFFAEIFRNLLGQLGVCPAGKNF